jgi:hypothetical protein
MKIDIFGSRHRSDKLCEKKLEVRRYIPLIDTGH